MKNKIKNMVIYIIVGIIIIASFKIPKILLELENSNVSVAVKKREKNNKNIDLEARNIYLVKAIHDMESQNSSVVIGKAEDGKWQGVITNNSQKKSYILSGSETKEIETNANITLEKIEKELTKLKEYKILKNFDLAENSGVGFSQTYLLYGKDGLQYTTSNVKLELETKEDKANQYEMEFEAKTGKILYIVFSKDNLNNEISTKEILENYIKYLDLYIIDDFKFENNMLVSEKAGLRVSLINYYGTNVKLSIHSNEQLANNYIYVEK